MPIEASGGIKVTSTNKPSWSQATWCSSGQLCNSTATESHLNSSLTLHDEIKEPGYPLTGNTANKPWSQMLDSVTPPTQLPVHSPGSSIKNSYVHLLLVIFNHFKQENSRQVISMSTGQPFCKLLIKYYRTITNHTSQPFWSLLHLHSLTNSLC